MFDWITDVQIVFGQRFPVVDTSPDAVVKYIKIASEKNSDMCCRYCIDDTDDELLTFTGKNAMTSIMNRVHDGDAELAAPFVPLQNERRELGGCSRLPSARSHRSKEEARNVKK